MNIEMKILLVVLYQVLILSLPFVNSFNFELESSFYAMSTDSLGLEKVFYAKDVVAHLCDFFVREIKLKAGPLSKHRTFLGDTDVGIVYKYKQYDYCHAAFFPEYQSLGGWEASRAYYFHANLPDKFVSAFGYITAIKILYGTEQHSPGAVGNPYADIWISVDRLDRVMGFKNRGMASCEKHAYNEVFQKYLSLKSNKDASLKDYKNVKILDVVQEYDDNIAHYYFHRREIHCDRILTKDYNTEFGELCPEGCWATIRVAYIFCKPKPGKTQYCVHPSIATQADMEEDFEELWDFVLRVCEEIGIIEESGGMGSLFPGISSRINEYTIAAGAAIVAVATAASIRHKKRAKKTIHVIYGTPTIIPKGLPEQIADHWSTKAIDTANKTLQVLGLKGSDVAGKYLDGVTLTKIGEEIEKGNYSKAAGDLLKFASDKLIESIPVIGPLKVAYDLGMSSSKWFKNYLKEDSWGWLERQVEKEIGDETDIDAAGNAALDLLNTDASGKFRILLTEIGQEQYGYYNWMHVMTPRGRRLAMKHLYEEAKKRLIEIGRAKAARNRLARELEKAHRKVREQ